MKKWIGICCAMALMFSVTGVANASSGHTDKAASPIASPDWWTDHGPNHKRAPIKTRWWTDHGPNHKTKDSVDFTAYWWTDHGPNH